MLEIVRVGPRQPRLETVDQAARGAAFVAFAGLLGGRAFGEAGHGAGLVEQVLQAKGIQLLQRFAHGKEPFGRGVVLSLLRIGLAQHGRLPADTGTAIVLVHVEAHRGLAVRVLVMERALEA